MLSRPQSETERGSGRRLSVATCGRALRARISLSRAVAAALCAMAGILLSVGANGYGSRVTSVLLLLTAIGLFARVPPSVPLLAGVAALLACAPLILVGSDNAAERVGDVAVGLLLVGVILAVAEREDGGNPRRRVPRP
jgi:hypothetical protein